MPARSFVMKLLVLAVMLAAETAHAGDCSEPGGTEMLKKLEAFAKKPVGAPPEVWDLCIEQSVLDDKARTKRLFAACEKILPVAPDYATCVKYSIWGGAKKLGDVDLFDYVAKAFPEKPLLFENEASNLYGMLDDARACPILVDAWKATLAKPIPKPSWAHDGWDKFRSQTAKFLGRHGGAAERAALEELAAQTKEAGIEKAIASAITAIDKRSVSK